MDSEIADIKNDPDGWAQAGSITAALFLQRFAPPGAWLHLDIFAWNPKARPGWPVGGEAQTIRALFRLLQDPLRMSDPRLTLARPDLAAADLQGLVPAKAYARTRRLSLHCPLRRPAPRA